MGWGWLATTMVACSLASEPVGNEPMTSGTAGSGSSGSSGDVSGTGNGETIGTSSGSGDACEGFTGSGPCATPGLQCSYADDCGSWLYECQAGSWVEIDGSGCGGTPIACGDGPVDGDDCDFEQSPEVCDPDGDCLDVLECEGYTWRAFAVCSELYCAEAAPLSGKPCDEQDRSCNVEHPCGNRSFTCHDTWVFIGGAICEEPQPCSAVPVPNDACDQEGEVCPPAFDGEPTLTCMNGKWND